MNGVTGLCMTPLNFVGIWFPFRIVAERRARAHKLPASGGQGKHARLLAAGAGKAQSERGTNNKCR
ncbi:MAG: hypothetical protein ACXU9C_31425, partial [Xanthobacteraceae bacterium]